MTVHLATRITVSHLREECVSRHDFADGAFLLEFGEPYDMGEVHLAFGDYGCGGQPDPTHLAEEAAFLRKLARMAEEAADELDPYGGDAEESQREWEAEGMASALG